MNFRGRLVRQLAKILSTSNQANYTKALETQDKLFHKLIATARNTQFGKYNDFANIHNVEDFRQCVHIREYEDFKSYIEQIKEGVPDVLWPGRPKYLCKTSGTTSGSKFIPITKESIGNHIRSARSSLFSYVLQRPDTQIFGGKMLFLSGSPELDRSLTIPVGRLSGIVNHEIPFWFKFNKEPNLKLNSIQPWERKIEEMVKNLSRKDIRVLSGIPPWIQMFSEYLLDYTGASSVCEVFPNLELYIHGGVNFSPYQSKLDKLFGKELCYMETYPASEGFISYQDDPGSSGMQLVINDGIFYEFIPKNELYSTNAKRLGLRDVQLDQDYAVVLSTNAGLWAYLIGDLVRFVSLDPFKIRVSGRVSQYISAFGEHVISSEIDQAISYAQMLHQFDVIEFTVAPQVNPSDNRYPYHEWFVEFSKIPNNLHEVALTINTKLCELNSYYKDLIDGNLLDTLKIRPVKRNSFVNYMRQIGRLGEQFKVHRLSNDRSVADILSKDIISS